MAFMRAELKHLTFDPDPATLSGDAAEFAMRVRMIVGPAAGAPGEESFDLTVCTPEWLADACRKSGGLYDARHHVIVGLEEFDKRTLGDWLEARVRAVEGATWGEVGNRLARLGYWEFEDYTP